MNAFSFKVRYNENLLAAGVYTIRYKVSFKNYSNGPILERTLPFRITIDPCKSTTLAFIEPMPYKTTTYYLQEPSFEFTTLPETIVSKDTTFDCGSY